MLIEYIGKERCRASDFECVYFAYICCVLIHKFLTVRRRHIYFFTLVFCAYICSCWYSLCFFLIQQCSVICGRPTWSGPHKNHQEMRLNFIQAWSGSRVNKTINFRLTKMSTKQAHVLIHETQNMCMYFYSICLFTFTRLATNHPIELLSCFIPGSLGRYVAFSSRSSIAFIIAVIFQEIDTKSSSFSLQKLFFNQKLTF